jgi:hypothetical protein
MEEDHRFERRAKRAAEHGEKEEAEEEHGEEVEKSEETPAEEPEKEQATGKDNLEASGEAEAGDDATVILMLKVLMSERSNRTGRCIECSEYVPLGMWLIGSEGTP